MSNGIRNIDKGNTEIVAEYISKITNSDLFKVETTYEYPYNYRKCCNKAKIELENNERPELKEYINLNKEYDTIYVGGPVWYGTYPMSIFAALDKLDLNGITIKPFTTHEGSGLGNTVYDLKRYYPKACIKEGLEIRGSSAIDSYKKIEKWCNE
jgi:flavodoxin